jgi:transcriptional regulator with XRE-family HTH domain
MDIKKLFAMNVRKYRLAKGLSQEKLAEEANLHRTYISSLECMKRSISLDNIQKIANALGVEPYQLFLTEEASENAR